MRITVAVIGCALAAVGALAMITPPHGGLPLLCVGVLILISLAFEGRYRASRAPAPAAWQPTGEKFIDPGTGKMVEVDYDPASGERNYRQTP